jgi:putative hemolysin
MFELIIIVSCLLINALLSASETAFIAVSKPALRELIRQGNEKAKLLFSLRENPERTLAITQIGITFLGAFAAAVGGAGAEEVMSPWLVANLGIKQKMAEILSLFIIVVPLTYINVVIGELVPKTLALRRPMFIASTSAPWLHRISRLIGPIVTLFEWSTKKIVNSFPKKHVFNESHAHDETIAGFETLTESSKQYVLNLVKIENTTVKEILVPWSEVIYLKYDQSLKEVEHIFATSGHTRLPVLKNEEVYGMINAKEFLAFLQTGRIDWLSLLRPALKTPDSTQLLTALRIMQDHRSHMAIVYERGDKSGIVTMEAIFEEIVGDIYDEDDDGTVTKILSSVHFKNPLQM